jgi:branched-chain amino acid transport system ATP-binding protein
MLSLALEGVSKSFGGVQAVADVSLEVPAGRVTGLIGPNGAGKTTVVNLITGVFRLTQGRIRLGDIDLTEANASTVARVGISRTFQNIRLLKEASVLDNVMIGFHRQESTGLAAQLIGLPASWRESRRLETRAQELLERFGMTRFARHPAGALSYGHQRRVEMIRAIASAPRVLLLDEPVAGMNDVEAAELGRIFQDVAQSGVALLLIEHNIRFVNALCDHVYVLDSGRMIAKGTPDQVMHDAGVIAAYLGTS